MAPRSHTTTPSSSQRPNSKKIVLKVSVADQDLINGKYRQMPSTPVPRPKRKYTRRSSIPPVSRPRPGLTHRSKRRRTTNDNDHGETVTLDEADAQLDDLDAGEREDREQQQHRVRQSRWPTLADFERVSDLSFPVLVARDQDDGCVARQQQQQQQQRQQEQRTTLTRRVRARAQRSVHCADCGVSAPSGSNDDDDSDEDEDDTTSSLTIPGISLLTPVAPWAYLSPRPTRQVDRETSSAAESVITRSGPVPQTISFWYDMTITEQARRSNDLDFKMLCLQMIRWRVGNCCENEMIALRAERGYTCGSDNLGWEWDLVLTDAVAKGKLWRRMRRMQVKECEKAAGWMIWERKQRRRSRGEFVEDQKGAWIVRAPGVDGEVRRLLYLGYRREGGTKRLEDDEISKKHIENDTAMNGDEVASGDSGTRGIGT